MSTIYLLDTNICIYIAKKHPANVLKKFETLNVGQVGMSLITLGELYYGAEKSQHKIKTLNILKQLTTLISALPLPMNTVDHYANIRASLEKQGKVIGNNDLWIAAHARADKLILVTNNTKEFKRVPLLNVENWV